MMNEFSCWESAVIKSPKNKFEPYIQCIMETFIVPAPQVGEFTIEPFDKNEIKVLKAYVRN